MLPIVVDLSVVSIRPLLPAPGFGEARMDGASESESVHLLVCCKPEAFEVWKIYRYGGRRFLRFVPVLLCGIGTDAAQQLVSSSSSSDIQLARVICISYISVCVCMQRAGKQATNR